MHERNTREHLRNLRVIRLHNVGARPEISLHRDAVSVDAGRRHVIRSKAHRGFPTVQKFEVALAISPQKLSESVQMTIRWIKQI